jgi:hypothetical protein
MNEIPFDRVVVVGLHGRGQSWTVEEFLSLPLDGRIRIILAREVEFFRGPTFVDRREALAALRRRQANATQPDPLHR